MRRLTAGDLPPAQPVTVLFFERYARPQAGVNENRRVDFVVGKGSLEEIKMPLRHATGVAAVRFDGLRSTDPPPEGKVIRPTASKHAEHHFIMIAADHLKVAILRQV